jgi:hypothetical protein
MPLNNIPCFINIHWNFNGLYSKLNKRCLSGDMENPIFMQTEFIASFMLQVKKITGLSSLFVGCFFVSEVCVVSRLFCSILWHWVRSLLAADWLSFRFAANAGGCVVVQLIYIAGVWHNSNLHNVLQTKGNIAEFYNSHADGMLYFLLLIIFGIASFNTFYGTCKYKIKDSSFKTWLYAQKRGNLLKMKVIFCSLLDPLLRHSHPNISVGNLVTFITKPCTVLSLILKEDVNCRLSAYNF